MSKADEMLKQNGFYDCSIDVSFDECDLGSF